MPGARSVSGPIRSGVSRRIQSKVKLRTLKWEFNALAERTINWCWRHEKLHQAPKECASMAALDAETSCYIANTIYSSAYGTVEPKTVAVLV